SSDTRVAILNACETGLLSSTQSMVGLGPRLLQRQLAAVVAMQYPITQAAAAVFTREFYRSLATGFPVDAAVSEARKGIYLATNGATPEWGTPVLFLRAKDGRLFEVEQIEPAKVVAPSPPEPTRPPEITNFVGREAELTYYAERLDAAHIAVISGM